MTGFGSGAPGDRPWTGGASGTPPGPAGFGSPASPQSPQSPQPPGFRAGRSPGFPDPSSSGPRPPVSGGFQPAGGYRSPGGRPRGDGSVAAPSLPARTGPKQWGNWTQATPVVRAGVSCLIAAAAAVIAFGVSALLGVTKFARRTVDPITGLDPTGMSRDYATTAVGKVSVFVLVLVALWALGYLLMAFLSLRGYPASRIVSAVLAVLSLFLLVGPIGMWPAILLGVVGTALLWFPSAGYHFRWNR